MKKLILIAALFLTIKTNSQVGIGTSTPSANSILDVNSASKGLMLPRLADTSSVTNPSAGLLIYNAHTKAPAYHNGTQWNALSTSNSSTSVAAGDSLTYNISGSSNGFVAGGFKILSWSHGLSSSGAAVANWGDLNFTKMIDANSIPFSKAVAGSTTQSGFLEIRVFSADSTNPRFSMKFTNFRVLAYQIGSIAGDATSLTESITVSAQIVGFKNWLSPSSQYQWNLSTNVGSTGY